MADAVKNPMRLWREFQTTDPKHTKKVEFGRKFTAIDAHWQIMRMTEVLGPVGVGWGYNVEHSVMHLAENMILAVADVTVWHRDNTGPHIRGDIASYGPIRGTCELYTPNKSGKMQLDEDAPKKAMTDALTKGLSHLGVSADVFLGLFDDNRYVQKAGQQWEARQAENDPGMPESVRIVLDLIEKAHSREELGKVLDNAREGAAAWTKPQKDLVALKAQEKRTKLGAVATAAE